MHIKKIKKNPITCYQSYHHHKNTGEEYVQFDSDLMRNKALNFKPDISKLILKVQSNKNVKSRQDAIKLILTMLKKNYIKHLLSYILLAGVYHDIIMIKLPTRDDIHVGSIVQDNM